MPHFLLQCLVVDFCKDNNNVTPHKKQRFTKLNQKDFYKVARIFFAKYRKISTHLLPAVWCSFEDADSKNGTKKPSNSDLNKMMLMEICQENPSVIVGRTKDIVRVNKSERATPLTPLQKQVSADQGIRSRKMFLAFDVAKSDFGCAALFIQQ